MVLLKWKLFILSLALVGSGGTPRELRGWTAAGRNSRDSGGFTHGACAGSGKIIGSSQQDSLAGCEYTCAITPGCVWYAYCAAHREPALPADHQLELCNDQSSDSRQHPLSNFGTKRNRCVLYSNCGDFGLDADGPLPFTGFYIFQLGIHSVIAGQDSRFPSQLPQRLKLPHHAPDALHPNLKFWFAPEALEDAGLTDGTRVGVWRNLANECWEGHFDAFTSIIFNGVTQQVVPRLNRPLFDNETLTVTHSGNCDPHAFLQAHQRAKPVGTWDGFLQSVGHVQQEHLIQEDLSIAPKFRAAAVNGYGALAFTLKDAEGQVGKSMYLYSALNRKRGFQSAAKNMFSPLSDQNSGAPALRGIPSEFTLFVLVRTRSPPGHSGYMGIVSVVGATDSGAGKRGFTLVKSPVSCTAGAIPPDCAGGKYASFASFDLVYGDGPAATDSGCADVCRYSGCERYGENPGCDFTWSDDPSARQRQEPDGAWRLVSVRARSGLVEGFVDGLHSRPPPLRLEGVTGFEGADALRVGAFDDSTNHPPAGGHLDGEVAELMLYDRALTALEMDRIAHYLRAKFDLGGSVRISADVAMPSRTLAIAKAPGCSAPPTACDADAARRMPYARDAPIRVHAGEPAAGAVQGSEGVCPTQETERLEGALRERAPPPQREEVVTIAGWWLFPGDVSTSWDARVMPAGVTALDILMAERHLKVTLGPFDQRDTFGGAESSAEAACKIWQLPRGHWRCSNGDNSSWGELGGISFGWPASILMQQVAVDGSNYTMYIQGEKSCAPENLVWHHPDVGDLDGWDSEDESLVLPTLRCVVPGGIGKNRQINIYWHGVRTSLPIFEDCPDPAESSVGARPDSQ